MSDFEDDEEEWRPPSEAEMKVLGIKILPTKCIFLFISGPNPTCVGADPDPQKCYLEYWILIRQLKYRLKKE